MWSFATTENTVLKRCLNRAEQSKNATALKEICGVGMDPGMYKPMRLLQITNSERDVQKILCVLFDDYINTFGLDVENEYLVCLTSAKPFSDKISDSILSVLRQGRILYKEFVEKCIKLGTVRFHDPIKKNSVTFFNDVFSRQQKSKNQKAVLM